MASSLQSDVVLIFVQITSSRDHSIYSPLFAFPIHTANVHEILKNYTTYAYRNNTNYNFISGLWTPP